jgi:DNA primase
MQRFNAAKQALIKSSSWDSQTILEEPLPPNKVEPYPADAFGLDKAARECRFEMIKIVREVNEVTYDPKVATDPYRNYRYLSPNVFRLLLPVSSSLHFYDIAESVAKSVQTDKEPLPSPEEIAKMKSDLDASIKECIQRQQELEEARIIQNKLRADKDVLEKKVSEQDEQKRMTDEESQRRTADESEATVQRETKEKDLLQKLATAESQVSQLEQAKRVAEEQAQSTNTQLQTANNERDQLRQSLASKENELSAAVNESNNLRNQMGSMPEVAVYSVVWGDIQLAGRENVDNQIRQYAKGCWGFTYSNDFFSGDTKPGVRKFGNIVYQKRGQNVVTLSGWEGENSAFR